MVITAIIRLLLSLALVTAATAVEGVTLQAVVSDLASPTFVTHAGDLSGRLFIVEQSGRIRVLQPRTSSPTIFLDIRSKVLSGGERGLLGLAFHPLYRSNGRFFVYYTRAGDGAIVIAEYRVSADENIGVSEETVLLTIPHPTNANHNGGMLAFGPGGYLYIGVGDGGSANDPPNNAQNVESLLGKILRINVDLPDAAARTPYSSPSSNPFVGLPGRDELFAIGLRNPWRFSFDRETAQLWVGDVGQNAREEVDSPITPGANYGWRVYEGSACTNVTPSLCIPENYARPLFDYPHTNGRCSVTGGFVYRGSAGTFPSGTYVYGDYCSGEIFAWDGSSQRVLLDTSEAIASFGEDERGELYVVGISGTISQIVGTACTYTLSSTESVRAPGGSMLIHIATGLGCAWTATSNVPWISITGKAEGTGSATISVSVTRLTGFLRRRTGSVVIAGVTFTLTQSR